VLQQSHSKLLSYRDVEEMMQERGLEVYHSTVFRRVQRSAPEINKRIRQHLKMSGTSYRVDETYIKVGKTCKCLYRAVDKEGQTIEFMLSAKRGVSAAKRFFKKMMRAEHRRLSFSISVDKNAAYPEAFSTSQVEQIVPRDCKLHRTGSPVHQEESASPAILQEVPYSGANSRRH
jgi:IS6 family transposase